MASTSFDDFLDGDDGALAIDELMAPLRAHAQSNISAGTIATDPEGNPATVRSGSVNHPDLNEGRITLIPFQWDGEILDNPDDAAQRAIDSGINWPSFETHDEATSASKSLSDSLKVDTGPSFDDYLDGKLDAPPTDFDSFLDGDIDTERLASGTPWGEGLARSAEAGTIGIASSASEIIGQTKVGLRYPLESYMDSPEQLEMAKKFGRGADATRRGMSVERFKQELDLLETPEEKQALRKRYADFAEGALTPEQDARRNADISADNDISFDRHVSELLKKKADEVRPPEAGMPAFSSLKGTLFTATEAGTRMVPGLAVGALTGGSGTAALAFIGGDVYGSSLAEGREMGLSEQDNLTRATANVVAEIIPESIPVLGMLGKLGGGKLANYIKGTFGEGAQEAITEVLQQGMDRGIWNEDASAKQVFEWLGSAEGLKEIAFAATIGTIMGGTLSAPALLGPGADPDAAEAPKPGKGGRYGPGGGAAPSGPSRDAFKAGVADALDRAGEDIDAIEALREDRQASLRRQHAAATAELDAAGDAVMGTQSVDEAIAKANAIMNGEVDLDADPDADIDYDGGIDYTPEAVDPDATRFELEPMEQRSGLPSGSFYDRVLARARGDIPWDAPSDTSRIDELSGRVEGEISDFADRTELAANLAPGAEGTLEDEEIFMELDDSLVLEDMDKIDFHDVRLKRTEFREALQGSMVELTEGGGGTGAPIFDINNPDGPGSQDAIGRVTSNNPEWFKAMMMNTDMQMSVRDVKNAVAKALAGKSLGVRQQRVVDAILDEHEGLRTDPVPGGMMEEAREKLAQRRAERRAGVQGPVPNEQFEAFYGNIGEQLEESEYTPEMDFDARAIVDMATELDALGGDADAILANAVETDEPSTSTIEAFDQALEKAYGPEQPSAPSPEEAPAGPAEPAQAGQAQDRRQTPAERGDLERRQSDRERRINEDRRARIEAMTPDERYQEIYVDPMTGLGNRRAFEEEIAADDAPPVVASIDADSLAAVNDNLGHDAGDEMLGLLGKEIEKRAGKSGFHVSGDEFYVLGENESEVRSLLEAAQEALLGVSVSSEQGEMSGLGFTYGIGKDKASADHDMETWKGKRTKQGKRAARKEIPSNMVLKGAEVEKSGAPSVEDIHARADELGVAWDNNEAFMDSTEALTGKRHLDELTPAERQEVFDDLTEGAPTPAPVDPWQGIKVPTAEQVIDTLDARADFLESKIQGLKAPRTKAELDALLKQLRDNPESIEKTSDIGQYLFHQGFGQDQQYQGKYYKGLSSRAMTALAFAPPAPPAQGGLDLGSRQGEGDTRTIRERFTQQFAKTSDTDLTKILRASGLRKTAVDTHDDMVERLIQAREAADTLGEYASFDAATDAIARGDISKETVHGWYLAVRKGSQSENSHINYELNLRTIEQWGVTNNAFSWGARDQLSAEEITRRANEAATSPTNDRDYPSEGQIEAENWKKGDSFNLHGQTIIIENPKDSERKGTAPDGTEWSNTMGAHYGDIKGTLAADGDALDVFVGPHPESQLVWVIDQIDQDTGKFDEHKVMMGFTNEREAIASYAASYDAGWKVGPVTAYTTEGLKDWIENGNTTEAINDQLRVAGRQPASSEQTAEESAAAPAAETEGQGASPARSTVEAYSTGAPTPAGRVLFSGEALPVDFAKYSGHALLLNKELKRVKGQRATSPTLQYEAAGWAFEIDNPFDSLDTADQAAVRFWDENILMRDEAWREYVRSRAARRPTLDRPFTVPEAADLIAADSQPLTSGNIQAVVSTTYASGMSAEFDMAGALEAGVPFGVDVGLLSGDRIDQLVEASRDVPVFIDSGAFRLFSESDLTDQQTQDLFGGDGAKNIDSRDVMKRYAAVIARAEAAGIESMSNFAMVMPDAVGKPDITMDLLEAEAAGIIDLIDNGVDVIVPYQRGMRHGAVAKILGGANVSWRVGIPSNAEAMSVEELGRLLRNNPDIHKLHLLGAASPATAQDKLDAINDLALTLGREIEVTLDGNVLRSKLDAVAGTSGDARATAVAGVLAEVLADRQGVTTTEFTDPDSITLENEYEIEETGEAVKVLENAGTLSRQLAKRVNVISALQTCING